MAKRNTRELILQTSLALFNRHGESKVTTNHIADEANISPGNLYYHFHSKQDIVLELFKRFAGQLDPILQVPDGTRLEAEDLWFQLHLSFELKGHYRFLYHNLADLTNRAPNLRRAFLGLIHRERKAMTAMIASLEDQGAMQVTRVEKELLLNNLMLASIFWIPFAELQDGPGPEDEKNQVKAIAGMLLMILPYLREPEHGSFMQLSESYLAHAR
jgi:AcrR family transcriptional regulator